MKKFVLLVSIAIICAIQATAQLNIVNQSQVIFEKGTIFVTKDANVYQLFFRDFRGGDCVALYLGTDLNSAYHTVNDLYQWFENHKKGESVSVKQSDSDLNIYKLNGSKMLISHESAEVCKALYKNHEEYVAEMILEPLLAVGHTTNYSIVVGIGSKASIKKLRKFLAE